MYKRQGIPHVNTGIDLGTNETVLIVLIGVIIGFYVLFASLGSSGTGKSMTYGSSASTTTSSASKGSLEILIWAVFIVLILMNCMTYFFNADITTSIKNLFSRKPEIDVLVNQHTDIGEDNAKTNNDESNEADDEDTEGVPEIMSGEQVFHIPGNKYGYTDAGAICDAYGGRLANYKEVEDAYRKGGDWCSYGWSADQMALFPTQYEKWQELQKIKGHENDCGRPGVNGGYIANPNVRFGINCFGHKPKITSEESKLMNETSLYPKTRSEIQFENKVDRWKKRLPNILVAPFNHDNWSII